MSSVSSTFSPDDGSSSRISFAIGFEIEEFDHLLDAAAMDLFARAHARQEQQFLPELRGGVPVTADQQIAQHGRILEQFDVLEGAGNAEACNLVGRLVGDVLVFEKDPA
jgi:hypothetical protein